MTQTFHDLIAANRRNSVLLVAAFILLIALTVFAFSIVIGHGDIRSAIAPAGIALIGAGLMSLWAVYGGAGAILGMSRAKPIQKQDDPQLYNVVEELSIASGLPMPKLYLIDDTALNAFATGRDPQHGAVAITKGLREKLSRDELQGVLAHEVSHVRNLDIRFAMLLAVLFGLLVLLCDVFRRYLWWGGGRSRRRSSSDRGGGGATAIIMVLAILLSIIAPILARMIQLAASRQREYLADASAVELTRNPLGLAGALQKLSNDREVLEVANRATQHLYIVNPIHAFEKRAKGLFSTHPPVEERIARLKALSHETTPDR